MFTAPNAQYNGGPVPPNLWPFFSTKSQAETLLTLVKSIAPDVVLVDGLGLDLWIPVTYLDEDTKIWVFKGAVPSTNPNNPALGLDEFAGSLWDRQTKPNPFVDGVGGKTLIATAITTDLVQLKWGKP